MVFQGVPAGNQPFETLSIRTSPYFTFVARRGQYVCIYFRRSQLQSCLGSVLSAAGLKPQGSKGVKLGREIPLSIPVATSRVVLLLFCGDGGWGFKRDLCFSFRHKHGSSNPPPPPSMFGIQTGMKPDCLNALPPLMFQNAQDCPCILVLS